MNLAVLELNDQSLLIQAEDGSMHAETGFARITSEGIETGEYAHAVAWREPQHSYNQYWLHLNQTPLAAKEKWARHHGDIAYAQLRQLWQGAGEPEGLVLLVPGCFTDDQLSLLLGMVEALPAQTLAIIDSALAACLEARNDTLYVDMQLHQTVITHCQPDGQTLRVADQEVFPALGVMQIHNSVARHISHLLIDAYRFDPLHASALEQDIYDRLPGWLTRLCWDREVSSSLDSDKGELPFILERVAVSQLVEERLGSVRSFLERHRGCDLVLSHASGLLAGLSDVFHDAEVAGQSAATSLCLTHHPVLLEQIDGLYRVRALAREASGVQAPPSATRLATHLLWEDHAVPLNRPVSIQLGDDGVRLAGQIDEAAALTVVMRNQALETMHSAPDLQAELPASCQPGEAIVIGGHRLRLIEVRDG